MFKLFLLLYADDIVVLAESEDDLKRGLILFEEYCDRWKLVVNISKTKVMVFRNGGPLRKNLQFVYKGEVFAIVYIFWNSFYSRWFSLIKH